MNKPIMTEKEFRNFINEVFFNVFVHDNRDALIHSLIVLAKEKGYIKKTALEEARESYEYHRYCEGTHINKGDVNHFVNLYEAAIKELQEGE